jgi:hypothetical protein
LDEAGITLAAGFLDGGGMTAKKNKVQRQPKKIQNCQRCFPETSYRVDQKLQTGQL